MEGKVCNNFNALFPCLKSCRRFAALILWVLKCFSTDTFLFPHTCIMLPSLPIDLKKKQIKWHSMKNKAKVFSGKRFPLTIFNPEISRIGKQFCLVIWDGNCKKYVASMELKEKYLVWHFYLKNKYQSTLVETSSIIG